MNPLIYQASKSINNCIKISNRDAIYLIALLINKSDLFNPHPENVTQESSLHYRSKPQIKTQNKSKGKRK